MSWTINKAKAKIGLLTKSEQVNWDCFQNNVATKGEAPSTAAKSCGDMNYKKLGGADIYEIRLGGKARATFTVDSTTQVVTVLQVGGHT